MSDSDNDRGSYIEEERNPMAVDGGGSSMIPQACHTEARISVRDPNSNILGEGLRKYRGIMVGLLRKYKGVTRSSGN